MGIASGPVQAYLLLPAVPFDSLLAPYVIVALLNCWAVYLLWSFARTYYGPLVALLAAGLYAVNPWAVIFSRRLWSDDMTAPFVALLVGSLGALACQGRRRAIRFCPFSGSRCWPRSTSSPGSTWRP